MTKNNLISKEDYIKPKQSRYYVPKINKKLTQNAMNKTTRYIQTMKPLYGEKYVVEANKVLNIAESIETQFTMQVEAPEAHKMAIRVNSYLEQEAKECGTKFKPIDYEVVLKILEKNRNVYRNLLFYFRGYESGAYSVDKGIYIHGGTGSGKTLVMQVFKEYTKKCLQQNSFRKVQCSDISDKAIKRGIDAMDEFIRTPVTHIPINMYIEDFGASAKHVKWMGNNIEPMGELIMRRYRYYEKYGTLTHVCTNIKPEDISKHFDPRVSSRINKMFNFINFHGFDWRKI